MPVPTLVTGAPCWNDLYSSDPDRAADFYGALFGWTTEPIEQDGNVVYLTWKLDGRTVGGMLPMGESFPPQVPANWLPYFGVEDLDATTATVERLGGRLFAGPMEMPQGRISAFADPHGAAFACWAGSYDPPPGG